ncbi:hypothetical protein Zmor_003947 [Zophobas morio]|uniref:V-SNARE coiled-coil homology domain-containing protein n=1 Tax=Zophobas morio TaxID=2755281 RepID=A0AA38HJ66_9CUCU|nr:hypothetical protein Zmor_003947 [Zophobas morio]
MSDQRIQDTQRQVDEVVDIMRQNVSQVIERDEKLTNIDDKSEALVSGANRFQKTSTQVKRRLWWKNVWWTMAIVGVILLIVLIILLIAQPWKKK